MLIDVQRVLRKALSSDAPLDVLQRESTSLSVEDRALLDRIAPDGLRITSFLVRKLRFERVCRGDQAVEEWFDRDPAQVAGLFCDYNSKIPPREVFPREEAVAFRAYLTTRGLSVPNSPNLDEVQPSKEA